MEYLLKNLTIGYGRTVIASNINAQLTPGTITCLLGPNGAGKSTLLRTLCAFQPSLSGELLINGRNISDYSPNELSCLISVVLTERINIPGMRVRELVTIGRSPHTNFWGKLDRQDEQQVNEAIRLTGIKELESRQVSTLSDGERQKVMIAKALAQQTPIILLDEPTAFLDFPSKVETMLLLKQLAHDHNKAILVSTHDLDLALQTADNLWLMGHDKEETLTNGKSRMVVGSTKELAATDSLGNFFANSCIYFDKSQLRFTIKLAD